MEYRFACPFGTDDDCPNTIKVETCGNQIDDLYGCYHVDERTKRVTDTIYGMIAVYEMDRYEEAMEARADEERDREWDLNQEPHE